VEEIHLGGRPLFLSGEPIRRDGETLGYVLVARSPLAVYQALGRMRSLLYPGAGVALLVAALAAWLLLRRALRPLERLGITAADIADRQDHTARLRYAGPKNEIGRLARTIDRMLTALERAHEEVAEANVRQRRFLAEVSHELRTPLTIMLSSLDVLTRVRETDPGFASEAMAGLRAEAERLARMVSQLLIMARSDRDAAAAREPIFLAEVVADACRQCAVDGEGGTLESGGLDSVDDAVVEGNADYLKQLFLILLDNALKYSPDGGVVRVSGGTDDTTVSISVADAGIGIHPEDLERIFDRFYRGSNARSAEGTGLGLAIARHIAEQHRGSITVDSQPGRGSRFTVTLPRMA
jgi:signal transduction histidine kinase